MKKMRKTGYKTKKGNEKMKKRIGLLGTVSILILLLCSCGRANGDAQKAKTPDGSGIIEEVSPSPGGENANAEGVNVLTGMPLSAEEANQRPVAVMLNNIKVALPQYGVSKADLIYEAPAEGGITRMLGVFQSVKDVGKIGSVRSTRLYYLELVQGLDAILFHAGGSEEAYNAISSRGITALDCVRGPYMNSIFWRDKDRIKNAGFEHSVFTSGEAIQKGLASLDIRKTHEEGYTYPLQFAEDGAPQNGTPAQEISVQFSNYKTGVFTYDASQKAYLVSQYGKPYVDGENNQQVAVKNVLVLYTSISHIPGDNAGRLKITLTGSGSGLYACDGKAEEIVWTKDSADSPFEYTYKDGTAVTFRKGNSYINIVNKDAAVSVSES